jgi:hypothetical protein
MLIRTKKETVTEGISALIILLFVYTAINKLIEHNEFITVISHVPLIGSSAKLLSWLLPSIELITAFLLFYPKNKKWGLYISFVMMCLFTIYIGLMMLFNEKLPCSCGGVLKWLTWHQHLLFNIFFCLLSGTGIMITKMNKDFIAINRNSRTPVEESRPIL